jgi:hypothetical protein
MIEKGERGVLFLTKEKKSEIQNRFWVGEIPVTTAPAKFLGVKAEIENLKKAGTESIWKDFFEHYSCKMAWPGGNPFVGNLYINGFAASSNQGDGLNEKGNGA